MAPSRTRNVDSDGPSTADVSANEDVEMKDTEERVDGFNKFGVGLLCNQMRRAYLGRAVHARRRLPEQTS